MKGKLIKNKDKWSIEYFEENNKILIPLHPSELKIDGLRRLKNSIVEFEIKKEYSGFRRVGEKDSRVYIEIYQNYAKIKTE